MKESQNFEEISPNYETKVKILLLRLQKKAFLFKYTSIVILKVRTIFSGKKKYNLMRPVFYSRAWADIAVNKFLTLQKLSDLQQSLLHRLESISQDFDFIPKISALFSAC